MSSLVPSGQQSGSKRQNLSGARLEKKRRADRESQRAGRERTRNYILPLEKLVESLKQGQEDERLQTLTRQCQELRQQNERLIAIFTSIGGLARSADILDASGNSLSDSTSSPQRAVSATTTESVVDQQPPVNEPEVIGGVMPIISYSNPHSFWAPPCSSSEEEQSQVVQAPNSLTSCTASSLPNGDTQTQTNTISVSCAQVQTPILGNEQVADLPGAFPTDENTEEIIYESINDILTMAELFAVISTEPMEDVDIAIRAVMNGWHVAAQMHTLDQGWEVLRQIDLKVFSCCGPVERLSILQSMRLKFRVSNFLMNYNRRSANSICKSTQSTQLPKISNYFPHLCIRGLYALITFCF
jgi:hypothetical protein